MYYINVGGVRTLNDPVLNEVVATLPHFSTGFSTGMTEQTPSQHDDHPQEDKEDTSPTVHSYGLKEGETLSFPVHSPTE